MKVVILSSHTNSLFWFRADLMKELVKQGHSVVACGPEPEAEWESRFKEISIKYRQVYVNRNGMNPFEDLKTLLTVYRLIRSERPDKVFAYQAKTVIYGCIAASLNGVEVYPLIAGLGSVYRGTSQKLGLAATILRVEYKLACIASKKVFFQNVDDRNEFVNRGLVMNEHAVIVNGSGVNLGIFRPEPIPDRPTFLFIGRLIRDKGLIEYLEACKRIKASYPSARCLLVGPFDSNPSALSPSELKHYVDTGTVEYFGEQRDVRPYIAECSTYVLPSYHEGTPKTVLEAMAMGRPIITTDAPGCRETVVNGENGYLVRVGDVDDLVNKMEYLLLNPDLCQTMGERSLQIARAKYDVDVVNHNIMQTMELV